MQTTPKIILVEDQALFAALLKNLIETEFHMKVIACVSDGREAVDAADSCDFDLILMDIILPELDGAEACRLILEKQADAKIIALSGELDVSTLLCIMKQKFRGVIDKHEKNFSEILKTLRIVLEGGHSYTAAYEKLKNTKLTSANAPQKLLSDYQLGLLPLFGRGLKDSEIADALGQAILAIRKQRQRIREKLNLNSTSELMQYAVENGRPD